MALYESVILLRQDISSTQVENAIEEFSKLIEEHKGKVINHEYWGLRTLAYRINKSRKAHYVMLQLDCPHEALQELERVLRINEDVMRTLSIKVDAHAKEPSIMMRSDETYPKKYNKTNRADSAQAAAN